MKRFTICGLRAFVDYVNDTVPKIDGKHFSIESAYAKVASYIVQHNI